MKHQSRIFRVKSSASADSNCSFCMAGLNKGATSHCGRRANITVFLANYSQRHTLSFLKWHKTLCNKGEDILPIRSIKTIWNLKLSDMSLKDCQFSSSLISKWIQKLKPISISSWKRTHWKAPSWVPSSTATALGSDFRVLLCLSNSRTLYELTNHRSNIKMLSI